MPEVSSFHGMSIKMYNREHPPVHFHVECAGEFSVVGIDPVELLEGDLPNNQWHILKKWAEKNQAGLVDNWNRLRDHQEIKKIRGPK